MKKVASFALLVLAGCTVQTYSDPQPVASGGGEVVVAQEPAPAGTVVVQSGAPQPGATGTVVVEQAPPPTASGTVVVQQTPAAAPGPIRCNGNESVSLAGATIENGNGPAIEAHGNCTVTMSNCTLAGRGDAVAAHGNATVSLTGCTIRGDVDAHGNATVNLSGSNVSGRIREHGNATIHRQ